MSSRRSHKMTYLKQLALFGTASTPLTTRMDFMFWLNACCTKSGLQILSTNIALINVEVSLDAYCCLAPCQSSALLIRYWNDFNLYEKWETRLTWLWCWGYDGLPDFNLLKKICHELKWQISASGSWQGSNHTNDSDQH